MLELETLEAAVAELEAAATEEISTTDIATKYAEQSGVSVEEFWYHLKEYVHTTVTSVYIHELVHFWCTK